MVRLTALRSMSEGCDINDEGPPRWEDPPSFQSPSGCWSLLCRSLDMSGLRCPVQPEVQASRTYPREGSAPGNRSEGGPAQRVARVGAQDRHRAPGSLAAGRRSRRVTHTWC